MRIPTKFDLYAFLHLPFLIAKNNNKLHCITKTVPKKTFWRGF